MNLLSFDPTRRFVTLLTLIAALTGCASTGGTRLYPGELRSREDVALVLSADSSTRIHAIRVQGAQQEKKLFTPASFEMLPGHYTFFIAYIASGYMSTTVGKGMELVKDVEPNHIYVIYPVFEDRGNKWHPVFTMLNSYRQRDCGGGCLSPDELRGLADEHFRGERREVTLRSWGGWQ